MGKNSKARRDAKVKARRQQTGARGHALGSVDSVPASLFRSNCSACGSEQLLWMSPADLAQAVPAEERSRVEEGIQMVGGNGEAWLCGACGDFGVMGDIEAG